MKKKVYRVSRPDIDPGKFCVLQNWNEVESEFDGADVGEKITIELQELTQAEYEALGDFRGVVKAMTKDEQQADHIWHVWMNHFADEESRSGKKRPHSLYEFKSLLQFLEWGWKRLQDAYLGKLAVTHQQCSQSTPEPITQNYLKCCLGVDVTKCDILLSLKSTFEAERNRECGQLGKYYSNVSDEQMYRKMANVCAWHIYKGVTKGSEGFNGIDTTEGHLMDVGDRMFWDRTYASMAGSDPGEDAH